jgi:hypothetical protein
MKKQKGKKKHHHALSTAAQVLVTVAQAHLLC